MQIIYIKSKDKQITENSQIQQTVSESAMAKSLLKAMLLATVSKKEVNSTEDKIHKNILASVRTKTTCFFKELILWRLDDILGNEREITFSK